MSTSVRQSLRLGEALMSPVLPPEQTGAAAWYGPEMAGVTNG